MLWINACVHQGGTLPRRADYATELVGTERLLFLSEEGLRAVIQIETQLKLGGF
jgi:hypothetical protein